MNQVVSPPVAVSKNLASPRWRTLLLPSALVLVAFVFAMYDTIFSLLDLWWHSAGYGHGLVVLAVCVYLLWLRREQIAVIDPQISAFGLLLSGGLIAVWFASRVLGVLMVEQIVLVLLTVALIMALYGSRVAKLVALPILYVFSAVPIWSYLVPLLQDSTAQAATRISRALGVPIYLQGIHMTIPDGVFLVAEVCAGISYLLAALSLGGFYALLNLRGAWARVVLVVVAFGSGIVFNWIRVAGIVLAGHYSSMQHPLVRNHIMYGWVLFVLVVFVVMVCGRLLEHLEARFEDQAADKADGSAAIAAGNIDAGQVSSRAMWGMAIVCAAVLSVPAYAAMRYVAPPPQLATVSLSAQLGRASGWYAEPTGPGDGWTASFQGPDGEARARYRKGQQQVDVQIGYFAVQRQGAEAVNDYHAVFDKAQWRRVEQKSVAAQVPIAPGLVVNELTIRHLQTAKMRVVWWWYWVDGQPTVDRLQAKVLQIRSIFSGNRAAAIIVMSSPVSGGVDKTRDGMRDWLVESAAPMAEDLRKTSR